MRLGSCTEISAQHNPSTRHGHQRRPLPRLLATKRRVSKLVWSSSVLLDRFNRYKAIHHPTALWQECLKQVEQETCSPYLTPRKLLTSPQALNFAHALNELLFPCLIHINWRWRTMPSSSSKSKPKPSEVASEAKRYYIPTIREKFAATWTTCSYIYHQPLLQINFLERPLDLSPPVFCQYKTPEGILARS